MQQKLSYQDFEGYVNFDVKILERIIHDGETELTARLETANAADQRALTLFGFEITALLALVSGLYAVSTGTKPDLPLMCIGGLQIAALTVASWFSLQSVRPALFSFPGSRPDLWNIKDWHVPPTSESSAKLEQALAEECYCLYSAIFENKITMEDNAESIKLSIDILFFSIIFSGILTIILIIYRIIS